MELFHHHFSLLSVESKEFHGTMNVVETDFRASLNKEV